MHRFFYVKKQPLPVPLTISSYRLSPLILMTPSQPTLTRTQSAALVCAFEKGYDPNCRILT